MKGVALKGGDGLLPLEGKLEGLVTSLYHQRRFVVCCYRPSRIRDLWNFSVSDQGVDVTAAEWPTTLRLSFHCSSTTMSTFEPPLYVRNVTKEVLRFFPSDAGNVL